MNTILEVKGLKVDYGNFCLDHINFSLPAGCITGFIGANGAGKTTTIKAILGLVARKAGDIKFFGRDSRLHDREMKNRIGVVFDEGYFYETMTMLEMKRVIAAAYSNWDETAFKSYMKRFGLNGKQMIATLSKGMRMKYAIALALSHHADLLIMDEPTSGLDPLVRTELMDILLEFMRDENKSVFFSSHITSDLDKVGDVVILIDKGKIILNEDKDMLLDTHGVVKGDKKLLDGHTRKLFLTLHETGYGFTGVTASKEAVRQQMSGVLIERPTIEEIMLAYVGGQENAV